LTLYTYITIEMEIVMIFYEKLVKKRFSEKHRTELVRQYGSVIDITLSKEHVQNIDQCVNDQSTNFEFTDVMDDDSNPITETLQLFHNYASQTSLDNVDVANTIQEICHLIEKGQAYKKFRVPKKNHTSRTLYKPHPKLLYIQRFLLQKLSKQFPAHDCAYGFAKNKSTFHHVENHVNSENFFVMDIQDFFPSCSFFHVATALEQHTTLSTTQIRALLNISLHKRKHSSHYKKTNALKFFQSIQNSLLSYIESTYGRRIARLLSRLSFHREPFLETHNIFFDEQLYIDPQRTSVFHQEMWSRDPYQLESFFGLRLWILFHHVLGHYQILPSTKQAFIDASNYAKQQKLYRCLVSEFSQSKDIRQFFLPQGSPLSPWLANLCCYEMDINIHQYAQKHNLIYSRYADDICLSGDIIPPNIVRHISRIIEKQAFCIKREKTRFLHAHQRQVITGFVLNKHISNQTNSERISSGEISSQRKHPRIRLPRKYLKKIRSVLHNLDCGRIIYDIKNKRKIMTIASLRGHLAYIKGHHPQAYEKLYKNSLWLQSNER
jgi:hypothetical protein